VVEFPLKQWSVAEEGTIREQIARICASRHFQQARRRQRFLEYVVNETVEGRGARLKGYTIALAVFDRPKSFDAAVDPVVRIEAGRLREKLRDYYEVDGKTDAVYIELPKGAYVPVIAFRHAPDLTGPPVAAATGPVLLAQIDEQLPVTSEAAAASALRSWLVPLKRYRMAGLAAACMAIAALIGVLHHIAQAPPETTVPFLHASKAPAIAVLPFVNLSGDPKQEYFSDGLTEDILTALSHARDLRVLARNTTFQYKGQTFDVTRLGQELKVRYVLEGSVRQTDDRIRVAAQLIDVDTGTTIWADRYDRKLSDVFLVQDEIVNRIASRIAGNYGAIDKTESNLATSKSPSEVKAYDLVLRANDIMRPEWTRRTFGAAKDMLLQAVSLDPTYARAHRELAYVAAIGWVFRFDATPLPTEEIVAQAVKAVQLDPADSRAHMVAAFAFFFAHQLDLFEREVEQALNLAPYDGELIATLGFLVAQTGQWDRGVALAEKANALNADAAIGWYHATIYYDRYLKGDYVTALEFRRLHADQKAIHAYVEYIPVYGQLGRKQEAREMFDKLVEDQGAWSTHEFEDWYRLWNMREEDIAKMMDGVRKAEIPETKQSARR